LLDIKQEGLKNKAKEASARPQHANLWSNENQVPTWRGVGEIISQSHLPSLYKREEFPLFGKEGLGKIF
jgi:hypothetical protein